MSARPDVTRHGVPRIRCVNCGRPVIWWLGVRWKHAAGGWKPQPVCPGAAIAKATK